jgi:putative endonuclease
MREYTVYILANHSRTIYIGVTNDVRRRVWQHQRGMMPGFTRQFRVSRLVYFERTVDVRAAIAREKQLKRWPRRRKERLIELHNAGWTDLSAGWYTD